MICLNFQVLVSYPPKNMNRRFTFVLYKQYSITMIKKWFHSAFFFKTTTDIGYRLLHRSLSSLDQHLAIFFLHIKQGFTFDLYG